MPHISMRRAASAKALQELKDVTPEDARAIRNAWKTIGKRSEARARIDALFRTYGVEYLGQSKRTGEHVYYCNAGDTYAPTILFAGMRMFVGCWGDLVERSAIRDRDNQW
jgi:hypothetical protein